ncbi:glycosyl hydrolase family 61-domain-containing protein [Rhizoctonia solani]|nr:glycosyl hydrolase family 61-domain-containing protein [Rhizoctonia solani]
MTKSSFVALALLACLGLVLAHGGVTSIAIGGTTYQGWQPFLGPANQVTSGRPYSSYDPILNPVASTMHCNDDGTAGPGQQTLTIAAGQTITSIYAQWTHAEGPYTVYLAACPNTGCTSVNSATVKWFKIYELGLISGTVYTGKWANGLLMANLKWDTVIPSNLKPGNYLIRWETLALHQSNTPQFYPECAQLQVTGSGTAFPSTSDPGVTIDIYSEAAKSQTAYIIPGPRIYPEFAGANNTTPVTSTASSSTTSRATTTSTTAPATTTTPSTGGAAQYAQCGGIGWTTNRDFEGYDHMCFPL